MGGWTKTPNCVLDAVPSMSEIELKLTFVLIRLTFGYHRTEVRMTYDDMQTKTGIKGRASITKAINLVDKRGFFVRGRRSMWVINSSNFELFDEKEIVQKTDFSSNNELDYSSKSELSSINRKEKEEKEKEENPFPFQPVPDSAQSDHKTTQVQKRINAILDVCGLSPDVPAHVRKAENAAVQIAFASAGFIRDRYAPGQNPNGHWYWYSDDWRGSKGQRPRPVDVVDTITLDRVAPVKQVETAVYQPDENGLY